MAKTKADRLFMLAWVWIKVLTAVIEVEKTVFFTVKWNEAKLDLQILQYGGLPFLQHS